MAGLAGCLLAARQVDEFAGWRVRRLADWPVGALAVWPFSGLADFLLAGSRVVCWPVDCFFVVVGRLAG